MQERDFINFLNARGLSNPNTIREYLRGFRDIEAYYQGKIPMKGRITQRQVDTIVGQIKAKYKTNSQIPRLVGLKWTLRYLGYEENDKCIFRVKIPNTVETMREVVLSQDDVQRIFEHVKDKPFQNVVCKTLYYSAMRRFELSDLNLEDVDFENQTIKIENGKGSNGQAEVIAISPICLEAIRQYLPYRNPEDPNEKALFISPIGRRISKEYLNHMMREIKAELGLKHLTCHIWRSSISTHLHSNGASAFHIQSLTRHRTLKVLQRYIRPSIEEKKKSYEQFCPKIGNTKPLASPEQPKPPLPETKIQPPTESINDSQKETLIQLLKEGYLSPEEFKDILTKTDSSKTSRYIA